MVKMITISDMTPFLRGLQRLIDTKIAGNLRENVFVVSITQDGDLLRQEFSRFNRELSDDIEVYIGDFPIEQLTAIDQGMMEACIQGRISLWHKVLFTADFDTDIFPTVAVIEG